MPRKRNPYIRIVEAAKRGIGVRLSADEVYYLAQDGAIETAASNIAAGDFVGAGHYRATFTGFEEVEDV
jgi:hypothetical protein